MPSGSVGWDNWTRRRDPACARAAAVSRDQDHSEMSVHRWGASEYLLLTNVTFERNSTVHETTRIHTDKFMTR